MKLKDWITFREKKLKWNYAEKKQCWRKRIKLWKINKMQNK